MNSILVTGASSFLGYHVVKRLNAESIRPRVLEPHGADATVLDRLDVERCGGHLHDAESMRAACVGAIGIVSRLRRRPPPITRDVLQIVGRYAWYDTSKARAELGWTSRPLQETLHDTIAWLRQSPVV